MRHLWISLVVAAAMLAGAGAGGCATTIVPPKDVQTPAKVYVVDSGRTSSLVIPDQQGGVTRYAYGDWDWYAMRKTGLLHAITALFGPTQGALGRKRMEASPDTQSLVKQLPYPPENVYEITVEQDKALALSRQLDGVFVTAADTYHDQPEVGLEFVHFPERYSAVHNSNHVTAKWLREMGAETRGWPVLSAWEVAPPPALPAPTAGRR